MLRITNTDPRLILWFKHRFGGRIFKEERNGKARTCYRWHASCRTAARVIEGCFPFFVLKREQAEIAIAFQSTLKGQGTRIAQEVYEKREEFFSAIKELKWKSHEDTLLAEDSAEARTLIN